MEENNLRNDYYNYKLEYKDKTIQEKMLEHKLIGVELEIREKNLEIFRNSEVDGMQPKVFGLAGLTVLFTVIINLDKFIFLNKFKQTNAIFSITFWATIFLLSMSILIVSTIYITARKINKKNAIVNSKIAKEYENIKELILRQSSLKDLLLEEHSIKI